MTSTKLTNSDYTIGWICALEVELSAALALLDEEHGDLPLYENDSNVYCLGRVGQHNTVIVCLPSGEPGISSAASIVTNLLRSFPKIRFGLMVGVGGGVPGKVSRDIRLGDVVVSEPTGSYGGVLQYDLGKALSDGSFQLRGSLNRPPRILSSAVAKLRAGARLKPRSLLQIIESMAQLYPDAGFTYPGPEKDKLFHAEYQHKEGLGTCIECEDIGLVQRLPRALPQIPAVYYGLIGSASQVLKDARKRDLLLRQHDIACVEMEAAGLMNNFPCLVIRGISDYCDSHKNDEWQSYAAATAAAYAKDLLQKVPSQQIVLEAPASSIVSGILNSTLAIRKNVEILYDQTVFETLPNVRRATYDAFSDIDELDARCFPGTRVDLLAEVNIWATNASSKPIFWLYGGYGTGKSTISRTVAESFARQNQLIASFFFRQGESDRDNAGHIVGMLIRQMILHIPQLREHVRKVLEEDPHIMDKRLRDQFDRLILEPCEIIKDHIVSPIVLVIDALDECKGDENVRLLIELFSQLTSINLKHIRIFLTSRPEMAPRFGFSNIGQTKHTDFVLHEVPLEVIKADISLYLEDRFQRIRHDYNLIHKAHQLSQDWPSKSNLRTVIQMAVPLFIVAATIWRFITSSGFSPLEQLNFLLSQTNPTYNSVNSVYEAIIWRAISQQSYDRQPDFIGSLRIILGTIVVLAEPLSRPALSELLLISQSDIESRLQDLHSVLSVPEDLTIPIRTLHKSFSDFLLQPQQSHEPGNKQSFRVCAKIAHTDVGRRCLRILSETNSIKQDICNLIKPGVQRSAIAPAIIKANLPSSVQYACRFWVHHLINTGDQNLSLTPVIFTFLRERFLFWFEAMCLIDHAHEMGSILSALNKMCQSSGHSDLIDFIQDARRFVLTNVSIAKTCPLQLYSSCLAFAPQESIVRRTFVQCLPAWFYRLPETPVAWNSTMQIFESPDVQARARYFSVAFSADGNHIASAKRKKGVEIWDVTSGVLCQTINYSEGMDGEGPAAFSSSGKLVAFGQSNGEIQVWDIDLGHLQYSLMPSRSNPDEVLEDYLSEFFWSDDRWKTIQAMAISTDDRFLVSGTLDPVIDVWDLATGQKVFELNEHDDSIECLAFSPDGRFLAAGSSHGLTVIWSTATYPWKRTSAVKSMDQVAAIAFSSATQIIAIALSVSQKIQTWDIESGKLEKTFGKTDDRPLCLAFAPDGSSLAAASFSSEIRVWDASSGDLLMTLKGHEHNKEVNGIAFSPVDNTLLASAGGDFTIRLWNTSIATNSPIAQHQDHFKQVSDMIFSHDGQFLITASLDNTIKIWSTEDKKLLDVIHTTRPANTLSLDALSNRLITSVGTFEIKVVLGPAVACADPRVERFFQLWIEKDAENVLWIPPEYRGIVGWFGDRVAIGQSSGQVNLLHIAFDEVP